MLRRLQKRKRDHYPEKEVFLTLSADAA